MILALVALAMVWPTSAPGPVATPVQAGNDLLVSPAAGGLCTPLPPPTGNIVSVSTEAGLWNAVNSSLPNTTILLADGTYNLGQNGHYVWITTPNLTLRSASGNREAVILDDNYSATEIVTIAASNVTVADLTIKRAGTHPIHVVTSSGANTLNTLIYNVHLIDPGQQAIKINRSASGYYVDNGTVACSRLELTSVGRQRVLDRNGSCYTGGVDGHAARNWVIRDNFIQGFWCSGSLSEHAVHMWDNSAGTIVERNQIVDCARGIGFGLGSSGHTGGLIRNNMLRVNQDVGIGLETSPETRVYNNTVYTANDYMDSIEYRFAATAGVSIINNLTNKPVLSRDGGSGIAQNNVTNAQASWFADAAAGDLHLAASISSVVDHGQSLTDVADDFDGDTRPIGLAYDIGADEYSPATPAAVSDLRVTGAAVSPGTLTATLRWTPPQTALTTTLRYSATLITDANWMDAQVLSDTLPGGTSIYTASVPFSGATVYFVLKSQNAGGWSAPSNNAFWPEQRTYLPRMAR